MDTDGLSRRHGQDGTLNPARREELVKLKLEAQILSGLYERLLSMKGFCLKQTYVLRWLFDVGGQGILYLVRTSVTIEYKPSSKCRSCTITDKPT